MANNRQSPGGIQIDLENGEVDSSTLSEHSSPSPINNNRSGNIKTLDDLALTHIRLDAFPVVQTWRKQLFDPNWIPEICDELPRLLTEFLRQPEHEMLPPTTRRARALKHIFCNKTPLVKSSDRLPGQTTTSFVGPVIYMEMSGYCIWPELDTIATRAQNPFQIKPEVAKRLNEEIFPYWLERRPVQEAARYSAYDTADYADDGRDNVFGGLHEGKPSIDPPLKKGAGQTPKCQQLFERVAFYLTDKATAVSHTTPDFSRVLKYGFNDLIKQLQHDIDHGVADTPEKVEFTQAVITVYEGVNSYAAHLAEAALAAGNHDLAAICQKVPAGPAQTLHEAVSVVWICYHLLLQENTNFGLSPGRLDQTLNSYYLNDWNKLTDEKARAAYTEQAVELMCHFFLRCSDHVPLSPESAEVLFAGSGSNQALTVGGTCLKDGKTVDAVNDMSYIILKATEMLAIRDPNVHARYHKDIHHQTADGKAMAADEVDPWLKRICQVNLSTRATPALHGDVPVIHSMANYYASFDHVSDEEALADAHDYASIGCIEQNADHKHYGHTGSTLLVLPAVLELAMFGGKHRSDGTGKDDPNLFYDNSDYTSLPLSEMDSMQQFIDAFAFQLDEMARHCVQFNNYLGRTLEKVRPSPLLSGLFDGPTNKPGQSGAKFRDVSSGGAKYNSSGVAIIGLADVIDSFCTIDALLFAGKITTAELVTLLDMNFGQTEAAENEEHNLLEILGDRIQHLFDDKPPATHEPMTTERVREITRAIELAPKYGAGVDETLGGIYNNAMAVKYTRLLTKMIQDVFFKYRTHRGGRYLTGYWSMTNHAGFGMLSRATPNGRKSNCSFASGITPCPGICKANSDPVILLDHMLSVASVDTDTVQNGYTYNLSLTPRGKIYFDEDTELFATHMKTFMDQNGLLVQLCVTSIDDFINANAAATAAEQAGASGKAEQQALAPYKDLMIRVAGYSAYYVTLSPLMRQEIIDRANFDMKSGIEQHGGE